MNASAADLGSAVIGALLRAAGLIALAIGAALTIVFAAAAAFVVAALVAGAALAMRLWRPRKSAEPGEDGVLEARRTPAGWIVEDAGGRKF